MKKNSKENTSNESKIAVKLPNVWVREMGERKIIQKWKMGPNVQNVNELLIIYIHVSDTRFLSIALMVYWKKKGEWNCCWWIVYEFSYLLRLCISFRVWVSVYWLNLWWHWCFYNNIFNWAPTQPTLFMYSYDRLRFDSIRFGMEKMTINARRPIKRYFGQIKKLPSMERISMRFNILLSN